MPGGFDASNEQLYVARAEHNGALIPGKLVPSHGVVYVAWGGIENPKENYEVRKILFKIYICKVSDLICFRCFVTVLVHG